MNFKSLWNTVGGNQFEANTYVSHFDRNIFGVAVLPVRFSLYFSVSTALLLQKNNKNVQNIQNENHCIFLAFSEFKSYGEHKCIHNKTDWLEIHPFRM